MLTDNIPPTSPTPSSPLTTDLRSRTPSSVCPCLLQVDLEAACAHHRDSFSNPAEFTIVLTGNTSLEAVMPFLTRYLATIPAAEGRGGRLDPRNLKALPFRFPEQPVVEDVEVS